MVDIKPKSLTLLNKRVPQTVVTAQMDCGQQVCLPLLYWVVEKVALLYIWQPQGIGPSPLPKLLLYWTIVQ